MSVPPSLRITRGLSVVVAVATLATGVVGVSATAWAHQDGPVIGMEHLPEEVVQRILLESLTGVNPADPAVLRQVSLAFNRRVFNKDFRRQVQAGYDAKVAALSDERYEQLRAALNVSGDHGLDGAMLEVLRTAVVRNQIHHFAGTGPGAGYGGNALGATASQTELCYPSGVIVDGAGRVIVADTYNHRVLAVAPDGSVAVIAGTGQQGNTLGATATETQLSFPYIGAVDGAGRVLFADAGNNRILAVAPGGGVAVIAGTGQPGNALGATATQTELNYPYSVAVDGAGRVIVADSHNNRILAVASDGGVAVIAGTGQPGNTLGATATQTQLSYPSGVAVDGAGRIIVADNGNSRILAVASDGGVTVIAGTGQPGNTLGATASQTQLSFPVGVAVDGAGRIIVADNGNHRVLAVAADGSVSVIAGTGTAGQSPEGTRATQTQLDHPSGVTVDSAGRIFITDTGYHQVLVTWRRS